MCTLFVQGYPRVPKGNLFTFQQYTFSRHCRGCWGQGGLPYSKWPHTTLLYGVDTLYIKKTRTVRFTREIHTTICYCWEKHRNGNFGIMVLSQEPCMDTRILIMKSDTIHIYSSCATCNGWCNFSSGLSLFISLSHTLSWLHNNNYAFCISGTPSTFWYSPHHCCTPKGI